MANFPTVSVYIPVYNGEVSIEKCLESIIGQTYRSLDIVVYDDGSADSTVEKAMAIAARDTRIRVVRGNHEGLAATRNKALKECFGEWVAPVDADDYVEPGYIEYLLNSAMENEADICMCGYSVTQRKNRFHASRVIEGRENIHRFFLKDGRGDNFAWGKLYRKKVLKGVEYPPGRAYEDLAALPYIIERTERLSVIPDVLYHYELSLNGITSGGMEAHREGYENTQKRIRFYKERYPSLVFPARLASMEFGMYLIKKKLQSLF